MVERTLDFLAVLKRLAERKVQANPVQNMRLWLRQAFFHRGDVSVAELDGLEVGEAPPGRAFVGGAGEHGPIGRDGLIRPPERSEGVAEADTVILVPLLGCDQLLEDGDLLFLAAKIPKDAARNDHAFAVARASGVS